MVETIRKAGHRWEDNIKIVVKSNVCGQDLFRLEQDRCLVFAKTVLNLRGPIKGKIPD
jgi:hypothetical protein